MRGILGTSTAEVIGPGSRWQIDATIADVYLVSRTDRRRIVGRRRSTSSLMYSVG